VIDFSKTQTDIGALVRDEAQAERGRRLERDFTAMADEIKAQDREITNLRLAAATAVNVKDAKEIADTATKTLTERVDWLVWMMRIVVVGTGLEVIGGLIVAVIMKGSK
jgi:hypothetical protein